MTVSDANYWQQVGEDWLATARQRLWREHHDAVVRQWLARWLEPPERARILKTDLFEEAIGMGILPILPGRGARLVGLDISPPLVAAARRHHGVDAVRADVRCLPFADGSFDAVISTSTLDHFATATELRDSLEALVRLLRSGGMLLITLDNLSNPLVRMRNALPVGLLRLLGLVPYQVGASCDRAGLHHLLEQAGTDVIELTAILHCPRVAMVPLSRGVSSLLRHPAARRSFLGFLGAWERLGRWPSRFRTGHFLAAYAIKR